METTTEQKVVASDEISAKELILRIQRWLKYIFKNWLIVFIFIAIGISFSFYIYKKSKVIYSADCTFTLDESVSNKSLGSSGGLALLGLGGASEGGLFQGKNLMWLYTSRQMLVKALLSSTNNNKFQLYVNWFLYVDPEARKQKEIQRIKFSPYQDSIDLTREQNELLSFVIGRIKGSYLNVSETKNSENFITVSIKGEDELFAKQFSDVLVKTVNDFYIYNKTKKIRTEIAIVEQKMSRYEEGMNNSMYTTATAIDATPYPNPNHRVLSVNAEKGGVGVKLNSSLYMEMVKLLEQNRMNLAEETPLIQVIDEPVLPLPVSRMSLLTTIIYSIIISTIISVVILTIIRVYKSIVNS